MERTSREYDQLLHFVVEHISIPKSLYEKAAARHRSLGEYLCREGSTLREFGPDVRPQGSFRFGTVNRPLNDNDEYDLDNVCVLTKLTKSNLTQAQLKHLYGEEIKAYAREHGMLAPVEEHNRCWRLRYADEVNFHLDTLPCVPEDAEVVRRLVAAGVPEELARRAVAITDLRHPHYNELTQLWPSSNPRGFARFFEQQAALGRSLGLREKAIRATVEDVPPYEWKTTLQASIQILKRHRDVMFRDEPDLAPISMIITNLAARAYRGEGTIAEALANIVELMPTFVRNDRPRVPNPADPAEDYADKWARDSRREKNFWQWHEAVKSDLSQLAIALGGTRLSRSVEQLFDVTLSAVELRSLQPHGAPSAPTVVRAAPVLVIPSAPKPWGRHA
jgi:hypothetical protein